jgi:hypothetical protein
MTSILSLWWNGPYGEYFRTHTEENTLSSNWPNSSLKHSVLERIWIKGSYPSQWLPQGERGPPKESKSRWIEILHSGSQEQKKISKFFLD